MRTLKISTLLTLILLGVNACSTSTVRSTEFTPAITDNTSIPENELLDIGVAIFDSGIEGLDESEKELTFSDVRMAETFYISSLLSNTLQSVGNWGVVRVIPHDLSSSDLAIRGTILQSDGETMRLHVNVTDSTGAQWIDKEYKEVASKFSYDPRLRNSEDSFQGLYNRIANDILSYRKKNLTSEELLDIRAVSQIQFAKSFAPQVFDDYLEQNRKGILEIKRLPASNDPLLSRIENIRERDYLYVDTLQEYYSNFSKQMERPYTEFRRISYEEVMRLNQLNSASKRNMILGIAAIIAGVAATQIDNCNEFGFCDNRAANVATYGGILAGSMLIRDALNKRADAQMHVAALTELGQSLELEVAPQTIELEEKTVTLSGSVDSQYAQWREILADIYANEAGELESEINTGQNSSL